MYDNITFRNIYITLARSSTMFSPGRKLAVVVALLLLVSGGTIGLLQLRAMRTHQQTTGTVVETGMETAEGGAAVRTSAETTVYRPAVSYTYTVEGETYTADSIMFGTEVATNGQDRAERVRSQFEAGEPVTVYYDPGDPSDAFLIPRLDFFPAGGLMAAGLLLFADALTPWSKFARVVLARVPLTMHPGSRFSTENPSAVGTENPAAILEAREAVDRRRTAPLWGANASAVWLACGVCITLTVIGYLQFSQPPYDVGAVAMLVVPVVLNVRVLQRVTRS